MSFQYSAISQKRKSECHADLQLIMDESLKVSMIDFGISVGYRSPQEQQELYKSGRSKPGKILTNCDGYSKKSKHNSTPSLAFDVAVYINGTLSWDEKYYIYLGGVITATAARLYNLGRIKHRLRWGGNFDSDADIMERGSFVDLPHYELLV